MESMPGAPLFVFTCFHALSMFSLLTTPSTEIRLRECLSTTRREPALPVGFFAIPELIEDLRSFLRSGLQSDDLLCPLLTSVYSPSMLPCRALQVGHETLSVLWFHGGLISVNSERTCRV